MSKEAPLAQLDSKPWVEKYRPKTLDDVAAHKEIIDTIKKLAAQNQLPHLLFYGPPGTGKTSTILAVARQIFGAAMPNMILELNASDDRGIDVVRQEIQDFASTRQIFNTGFKLVILDECDAMTKDAQFALRRVIEKYARNTRFCLICNYVSKIIPALQSRCTKFRYPPLDEHHVRERLDIVVAAEGVQLGEGGMDALVALGNGDMRRTLNILQSTHMASGTVSQETVYSCTGNPLPQDIQRVAKWLLNEPASDAFKYIANYQMEKGIALVDIVRELTPFVFQIHMPNATLIDIIDKLADVEHRLAYGTNERLQLGSLLGTFLQARETIVAAAK
mmetsp:Transcript_27622/g.71661  ORF Transcript_27622/g.71661 Transcript_27622/m.71661 type:complete len:334 (-) Transcript_27622:143-1144(-)|eukprot:jgi/Tetstr1/427661/TSEL_017786.t1